MLIGIAVIANRELHNIGRKLSFDMHQKYNLGIETALLPQHVSLKQSFPYDGDINEIEGFFESFFSGIKPFKIAAEKVEVKYYDEDTVLAWIKIRESRELREIHKKLCETLKTKLAIEPLGFDGEEWTFHSTLALSKIDKGCKEIIYNDYNGKEVIAEFEAREAVMFCNLGDGSRISEYFSLKTFNIG